LPYSTLFQPFYKNMALLERTLLALQSLFHAAQTEDLKWKQRHQADQLALKHAQILAEKQLETQLQKKTAQLAHEMALLNTEYEAQLEILKTKYRQEIKDYKQYLHSLEQLKVSIQKSYRHLPEAVAFTIHHHAKQLLNQMWETEDFQAKLGLEMQLLQFMTTVHEESRLYLAGETKKLLPEKTLALIQHSPEKF
jgi:hypothetical protein